MIANEKRDRDSIRQEMAALEVCSLSLVSCCCRVGDSIVVLVWYSVKSVSYHACLMIGTPRFQPDWHR